jgi:hypothetical protein
MAAAPDRGTVRHAGTDIVLIIRLRELGLRMEVADASTE